MIEIPDDEGQRWGIVFNQLDTMNKTLSAFTEQCGKCRDEMGELRAWRKTMGTLLAAAWAGLLTLGGIFIKRG